LEEELKRDKKRYFYEKQKKREFEDWFEEKVAVEFQLEREIAK
jgi:hypothetical protein